jgi:hypothetical protein
MGMAEAERGMSLLEQRKQFDYAHTDYYVSQLRAYIHNRNSAFGPNAPLLIDVTHGTTELPSSLIERVEAWMMNSRKMAPKMMLSPYMRTFAKYYLLSLLVDTEYEEFYAPIANMVAEGGHFYIENGIFFVLDAAMVQLQDSPRL